jgi:hypothetical protein
LAVPTDDETTPPSTFPDTTQGTQSPFAPSRESSPFFDGEFTAEEWAAAAAAAPHAEVPEVPQETPLERRNTLIVKKLNTRSGKLMITRAK